MARAGTKGWATMALAGLGVAAILAGLMLGGGPAQGRLEKRDDQRRSDLRALRDQLQCLAYERRELTPRVESTAACPDFTTLSDPLTGQAYVIEQIDDENLRLCASFETTPDERIRAAFYDFDEDGCMVMTVRRSAYRDD